jgi:hypothetical protein
MPMRYSFRLRNPHLQPAALVRVRVRVGVRVGAGVGVGVGIRVRLRVRVHPALSKPGAVFCTDALVRCTYESPMFLTLELYLVMVRVRVRVRGVVRVRVRVRVRAVLDVGVVPER